MTVYPDLAKLLKEILASPSLRFMSSAAPPLLLTVAPRYMKLSTSSRSFQFKVTCAFNVGFILITCVLLVQILSLIYPPMLITLLVFVCFSCLLLDIRAIPSAKSRSSYWLVNFHNMPGFLSAVAFLVIHSINVTPLFRPPFWDLLVFQLLRPDFSNLPCLYSTVHLEYSSVLSRVCFRPDLTWNHSVSTFRG